VFGRRRAEPTFPENGWPVQKLDELLALGLGRAERRQPGSLIIRPNGLSGRGVSLRHRLRPNDDRGQITDAEAARMNLPGAT